jgi:predicted GH43/DUF377 family glycosyl hydrolase
MSVDLNGMFQRREGRDIVHRWEGNPYISIGDLDFQVSDIHNANAIEFQGKLFLLVTIESLSGVRCIHLARPQQDGVFRVDSKPFLKRSEELAYAEHESHGVMDVRATCLDDVYYLMYVALGRHGYRLGIAQTESFESVTRIGMVSEPDTKAGALFPRKINGRFVRLERPGSGSSIWVSYSEDLVYWGDMKLVMTPRGGFWDSNRIGVGPVPMETDRGWLVVYYGVKDTSAGSIYRIGAVVLDKDDPTKVIGRTGVPILSPRETYERLGDVQNVVFCTGAHLDGKGKLHLFYGASDSCICIGTTSLDEIFDELI